MVLFCVTSITVALDGSSVRVLFSNEIVVLLNSSTLVESTNVSLSVVKFPEGLLDTSSVNVGLTVDGDSFTRTNRTVKREIRRMDLTSSLNLRHSVNGCVRGDYLSIVHHHLCCLV